MTIYQRMMAVFELAGVEGFLQRYEYMEDVEPGDIYADYTVMTDGPALCADDAEIMHMYRVYIDLHGKTDVSAAMDNLLQALELQGFDTRPVQHLDGLNQSKWVYHKRIITTWYGEE